MASDTTGQSVFEQGEIAPERAQSIVDEALAGADDGELFLEIRRSEVLSFDDSRLRSASFDSHQGFGLRAIRGETTALAHSTQISESALRRAAETVRAVHSGHSGTIADPPVGTNRRLYGDRDPVAAMGFADKVQLLTAADAYARAIDSRVRQVSLSLAGDWQSVEIIRRRDLVEQQSTFLDDGERHVTGDARGDSGGLVPGPLLIGSLARHSSCRRKSGIGDGVLAGELEQQAPTVFASDDGALVS